MFVDSRTLQPGNKIEADICIIGTGPVGITLARQLAGTKQTIVCLESGGLGLEADTQGLANGQIIGLPYYPLISTRLRYFGGTSGHWGGYCRPFNPIDFVERPWVPHSGWPITYDDVASYYPTAQEICDLGKFDYSTNGWELSKYPPLPLSGNAVLTRLIQFSPPTRFGTKYQDEFAKSTLISVYLHANVTQINAAPNGKEIVGLTVKTLAGNQFTVRARIYILAAGGIENARLLLCSNNVANKGLGNDRDVVGRYFCEHIQVDSAAIFPINQDISFALYNGDARHKANTPINPASGRTIGVMGYLTLSEEAQRKGQTLNYSSYIYETYWSDYFLHVERATNSAKSVWRTAADAVETVWDNLRDAGRTAIERLPGRTKPKFYKIVTTQEQAPNPQSRVVLGTTTDALGMRLAQLDWQLTDLDRHTISYSMKQIAMALGGAGIAKVQLQRDFNVDDWPSYLVGSWHHCGTTRMSSDPAKGVVDANCKVHGLANLYVAGSSIFTTNGHGNPTLTAVALGLRLADHLRSQRNS